MNRARLQAVVRRLSPAVACAVLAIASVQCAKAPEGAQPLRRAKQKVFVIGFDGMDPTLTRQYMDEGKLPHLKKLSEEGVFSKLETTQIGRAHV